jgi:uncharacterized cupredoxin-like copper-binding protein
MDVLGSRSLRACAAAIGAAALLASCSGSTPPPSSVSAKLSEFKVDLSSATGAAGEVTFNITNSGTVTHEFVVIKSDLASDKLPATAEGKVDEESTELTGVDEVEDIAAGSTATLKVDLEPGHYVLICNLPGHYTGGMRSSFEVAAKS